MDDTPPNPLELSRNHDSNTAAGYVIVRAARRQLTTACDKDGSSTMTWLVGRFGIRQEEAEACLVAA